MLREVVVEGRGPGHRLLVGLATVATLLLVLASSGCSDSKVSQEETPAVGAGGPDQPSWRRAMLSVYFHSRFDDARWMPMRYRPMSLSDAVNLLADDESPFSTARLRRAIAKLYLAPRTPERREALIELGAPLGALDDRFPPDDRLSRKLSTSATGSASFTSFASLIHEVIGFLEGFFPLEPEECERSFPSVDVDFDWSEWVSDANYSMSVERTLTDMRAVLDPQNWVVCHPDLWLASYVVLSVDGADESPLPHPTPPTPGSEYEAALFEYVVNDFGLSSAWFKVVLQIDSQPSSTDHVVNYDLVASVRSGVFGSEVAGGVLVDEGWLRAESNASDPSTTDLTGRKLLRMGGWGSIQDFFINFWTAYSLEQMGDEMYEAVCCRPE